MTKPFVAARIPQNVADHLEAHCKKESVGKTNVIVNALAQYLGCSIENPIETNAIDRLSTLEEKVERLESLIEQNQKSDNKIDKNSDTKVSTQLKLGGSSPDNEPDKHTDKKVKQTEEVDLSKSDKEPDNSLLTTRKLSEQTGINYNTLKTRFSRKSSFEHNGIFYSPVEGSKPQSWEAESIS